MAEGIRIGGGGGSKVFLDGVKYKEDLSLQSEFLNLNTQYGSLPMTLQLNTAVVLDEKINLVNGTSHYVLENDEWVLKSTPPEFITKCFVHNNKLHGLNQAHRNIYVYDNNAWTLITQVPFTQPRFPISYKGDIYILSSSYSSNGEYMYKFDGTNWSSVGTLPIYLNNSGNVIVYNDEIHITMYDSYYMNVYYYIYNGTSWRSVNDVPFQGDPAFCEAFGDLYAAWSTGLYKFDESNAVWNEVSGVTLPSGSTISSNLLLLKSDLHLLSWASSNHPNLHYNIYSKYYREV